jgi:hypothetical protein
MQLTQVVPRLGPWDGVGDYAAHLGDALQRRHGVTSRYVEAGGADGRRALLDELAAPSGGAPLLLHYVGYGYARRGAPLWLARAIDRRPRQRRFVVVFHELYATGRPWHSAFWLSSLQRHVVTRLARQCHGGLVTRAANREWLDATGALAGKRVAVLPISSNVGEPAEVRPFAQREPKLVVWGSAAARGTVYGKHWVRVRAACRRLGVSSVVDVGPPMALPKDAEVPIDARGRVDTTALSGLLLEARFGLVVYPASFLAKSSIFAAYAAHGLAPLVLDEEGTPDQDGLAAGRTYLPLDSNGGPTVAPEGVARSARGWYASHDTAAHADAVRHLLEGAVP